MVKNYFTAAKACLGLVGIIAFATPTFTQTFTNKTGYLGQWAFAPGMAHRPTNSIYLMGTFQFGDIDQFIRYNIGTNSWSIVPGVPAIKSEFGFSFVVNNRIFFGGGVDQPGTFSNVVHEFTPPSSFSTVDNIPNGPASAFSFGLGNYGYVGGGYIVGNVNLNTMYRFEPSAASGSQWTSVTAYPGSGKTNFGKAVLNGYAYVGLGRSNPGTTAYSDFWRFDPTTGSGGTWTAMAPFPGAPRECPIITPNCGKLILMGGVTQSGSNFNDIWQFDPNAGPLGTWTLLGTSPNVTGTSNGRYGPAYAAMGDSLFLGMGFGSLGANNDWKMFTFCPIIPLPVELISFEVKENHLHQSEISWSTSSETNNSHFEVYHSTDAIEWKLVERIEGAGNSNMIRNYHITHLLPSYGVNYYQLKQVDLNGDETTFDITSIHIQNETQIMVFPNPVISELNINHNKEEILSYEVVNSFGVVILEGKLLSNQNTVSLATVAPGLYYLKINGSVESKYKIIKE